MICCLTTALITLLIACIVFCRDKLFGNKKDGFQLGSYDYGTFGPGFSYTNPIYLPPNVGPHQLQNIAYGEGGYDW